MNSFKWILALLATSFLFTACGDKEEEDTATTEESAS